MGLLSPPRTSVRGNPRDTILIGHHPSRIVAGNEPAVSGGLGSQVITHRRPTPCSPGAPQGTGAARTTSQIAVRTAHRLRSGYDTTTTSSSASAPASRAISSCSIPTSAAGISTSSARPAPARARCSSTSSPQDLAAGAGLALLDPHGDLAEAVLAHVPRARTNDLVYINPADLERPIGFNPLSGVPEDLKPDRRRRRGRRPSGMSGRTAGDRGSITS